MNGPNAMMLLVMCGASVLTIKILVDGVARVLTSWRDSTSAKRVQLLEERLGHLATSIDAIAVELERQGELQRFTARVHASSALLPDASPAPRPAASLARQNTPH